MSTKQLQNKKEINSGCVSARIQELISEYQVDYKYRDHEHCFDKKDPPCGFSRHEYCCLCGMNNKHYQVKK